MPIIERDDLIRRVVEVLDREDPGGQPTIVATAIVDDLWPDIVRLQCPIIEVT